MRILNVDVLICDRCTDRFELRKDNEGAHGYGTVIIRNISSQPVQSRNNPLSERETQVVECLKVGKSNKEIAQQLGIGAQTVKVHLKNVMRRFNVNNRTKVVMALHNKEEASTHLEAVTSEIQKSADLCPKCLAELEVFMMNGKEAKDASVQAA